MNAKIHESQIPDAIKDWHLRTTTFTTWLLENVGHPEVDWKCTYNFVRESSEHGYTWWFRDERMAVLTLLTWS